MAGRNISASKMAMGSTRVMGTCAIGGQAVGTAAAMCIRYGCMPREILNHFNELQQVLLRDDCYIPGILNADALDLATTATVTATSEKEGYEATNVIKGITRNNDLWISDGMRERGETVCLELKEESQVSQVRLVFDSNFNYSIKQTMSLKRQRQQRMGVPEELIKDYTVTLWKDGTQVAQKHISENHQRLNIVEFESVECDAVTVTVNATNGAENAHIYEIRIYS